MGFQFSIDLTTKCMWIISCLRCKLRYWHNVQHYVGALCSNKNAPSKAGVVFPVEVPKRASGNWKQVCGEQLRKWMYVLGIDSRHVHDEVGALKWFVTYKKANEYLQFNIFGMLTPQRRVSIQHLQHETIWIRWFNIRGNTMLETNRCYVLCICMIGIHMLIRQHIQIEGELCLLTMTLQLGMITLTNDQLPVNTCNQSPGLDR